MSEEISKKKEHRKGILKNKLKENKNKNNEENNKESIVGRETLKTEEKEKYNQENILKLLIDE